MTDAARRAPAQLALPDDVDVARALVAHPEVVVGAVVGDLAPVVAWTGAGAVGEGADWHCFWWESWELKGLRFEVRKVDGVGPGMSGCEWMGRCEREREG